MTIHKAVLFFLLFITSATAYAAIGVTSEDVERALRQLDSEIQRRDSYLTRKRLAIDSLRTELKNESTPLQRIRLMEGLGTEYTSYNNDSALHFFSEGNRLASVSGIDSLSLVLELRRLPLMPLAGFRNESIKLFNAIDTTRLSKPLRSLYFDSGRQMFSYIASFFQEYPQLFKENMDKSQSMQDHLLETLPVNSPQYQLNLGEHYFRLQEYSKAKVILMDLIEKIDDDDKHYAIATNLLATIARRRNNQPEHIYYLTRSAIADIKSGTLEVASLQELGRRMFEQNEIDRAHAYLMLAHKNAVECHALQRILESSESMPLIESAHTIELNRGRKFLIGVLIIMVIMLAGLLALLLILRREMKRMNEMKERLRNANHVKEIYISQFLNLCSIYMDKLNQFCKVAHRKISTGKVDDLYKLTKSGKFVEEQSREFYEVFDEAFLHIYPTFLTDINTLLRPDEQIELKDGEKLNTDLRILAFMRLGIEESTRIAQVLNYSVYTIYTYRNKLKNRAISRETFEDDVMRIGAMD